MSNTASGSQPAKPPTIDELTKDADAKRTAYLGTLDSAKGPTAKDKNDYAAGHTMQILSVLAEQQHAVERDKLAYEESLQRLQAAQANEAQSRMEKIQVSMKCATWVIAVFTLVAAAAALWAACK